MLLVHKVHYSKLTKAHLLSLVASSKGFLQDESNIPRVRTSDGFDLNTYKLMENSDYDFNKPPALGDVVEAQPYGLNNTQKIIQT